MDKRFVIGFLAAGMLFAADPPKKQQAMSDDMRQAIEFEHFKDAAAARQARLEARHPSVTYSNSTANRSVEDKDDQGKPVKDPGPSVKK